MSKPTQEAATQIIPLPVGSGSSTKDQMNKTNEVLTMIQAQSNADTRFDPPPIPPEKPAQRVENFCNESTPSLLMIVAVLLIVYGIVAK